MSGGVSTSVSVVHVCCTESFAGVERHVSELARSQRAAGADVAIVGGDLARVKEAAGGDVHVLPGGRIDVAIRSMARLPFRPDVINAHMTAAELATAIGAPRNVPVVSTRHFASRRGSRRMARPVTRWAHRHITAQVAVSRYVAEHVEGVSSVVLSGTRAVDGLSPSSQRQRVVLVAQRLENEKRTDLALRAFALSDLARDGWRLQVAGDGALRPALDQLANQLGLGSSIDFLGHRSDVHQLMQRSAIFLAPRPDEAFGLSVVEAMARGLPVVAAGSGAHLETVGSVPGAALFSSGSSSDAARVLTALADDAARRDSYGAELQAAQRHRFTVELQARNTDAVYRDVL